MVDYLRQLRANTDEFASVLRDADLDARVVSCPGWTVARLARHLGEVHLWATKVLQTTTPQPQPAGKAGFASSADAADWYADAVAGLVDTLAEFDSAEPCWNFAGVHLNKGFWPRRQTHEVAMHLVDLTRAAGVEQQPIDPAISADGVVEVFEVFMPRQAVRGFHVDLAAPIAIVAGDAGKAWTLTPRGPTSESLPDLQERAADDELPPNQLIGEARPLHRLLWKRAPVAEVEMRGDLDVVRRYLASPLTP